MSSVKLKPGANYLPRGGFLVPTSVGYIQFGIPPESIKDTMRLPDKVPRTFVLPGETFHVEKGIALAELEFPLYFNHFLCQQKTLIICTEEQKGQLIIVLTESVFGPEVVNLESEFPDGKNSIGFPDMEAEMRYFRGNRELKDLIEFGVFKEDKYKINDVEIVKNENVNFEVNENGTKIAEIPWSIPYQIKYDIGERLKTPFKAPNFGITCLGPSHGFDPEDNTSGFILWINKRGIMIDPPVNSTEWLRRSNVNPKLIHHVILTHCHADHDAGTFQKILEEFVINIHTTETVMNSFIRKYTALTKLSKKNLYEFFSFKPIMINKSIFIEGAEFIFHYSLHSIPALAFSVQYRDKSFFYSSDHLNHPETIDKMNKINVFTKTRYEYLKNFSWNYDIIYHEAGIPPLHTPISYLASLPESVQERTSVYHIAKRDFPKNTKLTLAKFGIEHTMYPKISKLKYAQSIDVLDVVSNVDLFENFTLKKAREFLMIMEEESFSKGEQIIKKGTKGDKFFIIVSGLVSVRGTNNDYKKTYGKYEYFGEASLITEEPRSANVVASTDINLITIRKNLFLNFIQGTSLANDLNNLAKIRESNSWDTLSRSKVFGGMTSHQKTQLETILNYKRFKKGEVVLREDAKANEAYILAAGKVKLERKGLMLKELQEGDFVGDVFSLQKQTLSPFSACIIKDSELYCLSQADLCNFIQKNPGVYMRLIQNHADVA